MASISEYFRQKILRSGSSGLESLEGEDASSAPLSDSEVRQIFEQSTAGLRQLVEYYPEAANAGMEEMSDLVRRKGMLPLQAVADRDDAYLEANPGQTSLLEVIVNTDGSRPSFVIRNDKIDVNSSPAGDWRDIVLARESTLLNAIQCTGRVNKGEAQIGTGFLVSNNLMVTNRHVLQALNEGNGDGWKLDRGANIDFGHEFKGRKSVSRRRIKKVVYAGPEKIDIYHIDHRKLDLAVLELEEVDADMLPRNILQWDSSTGWEDPGIKVFIVGYPGDPQAAGIRNYTAPLLDKLFAFQFGCKRLAPGKIIPSEIPGGWTFAHDATTLGGNSGSLVVILSDEGKACGLHYGGDLVVPRQNWGHILGKALHQIGETDQDLFQHLTAEPHD